MTMILKKGLLYPALFFLTSFSAHAQTQLDDLISEALQHNPEIAAQRFTSEAARTKISIARQLPDPEITVAAMNVPTSFSLTSEQMTMVPQLTVMQTVPWFGKLSAAGSVASFNYEASRDQLSEVSLEIIATVKKVYAGIFASQQTLKYMKDKSTLLAGVVKVANQLFAVGQAPQQDVFRATAELTMVQSDIVTVTGTLQQQYADLSALTGTSELRTVKIDSLDLPHLCSLATLDSLFVQNNPSLSQIAEMKESAAAEHSLAAREAIPDIKVGVGYGYRGALMPTGTKALNMMNFEIGMNVPIFFGSKQKEAIEGADLMEQAAVQRYRAADLTLRSRLCSMNAAAEANYKLMPIYSDQLIPQYTATYEASLSAYSVGKTTFAMVMDNLTTLIDAKITLVKIESSYFSSEAEISQLIGDDVERYRGEK
jgi:outer membrane protein, heavy metal efflux system